MQKVHDIYLSLFKRVRSMKGKERWLVVTREAAVFLSAVLSTVQQRAAAYNKWAHAGEHDACQDRRQRTSNIWVTQQQKQKRSAAPQSLHAQPLRANIISERSPSVTCRVTLMSERRVSSQFGPRRTGTDLPLSLPTPQTRMLPIGWAWSRVWPSGSIRFIVSFSRTISMSLPCPDAQCQRKTVAFGVICFQSGCPNTVLTLPIPYRYFSWYQYQHPMND